MTDHDKNTYQALFDHNPDALIACPACDTLHKAVPVRAGNIARCTRCHFKLMDPKPDTLTRTVALSITASILMVTMLCFPFLTISQAGLTGEVSMLEIIFDLSHGWYNILAVMVAAFVLALPIVRMIALIYVMWPLHQGRPPPPAAQQIFLFAEKLNPWAMTEIFIVGTVVALIKMMGLATIGFGTAFWLFCGLVVVVALKNAAVCRWTVWSLIRKSPS
jgi:paraquat-inducible protein A